jgi:cytochrome c oxidase accessory protein FixG
MSTIEPKTFRDRPLAIDESGKRKWIYAKQPVGKWYTRRSVFAIFVLLFLVFAPIIKINGNPFMLIDIAHRRFSLFGNIIWAQDTQIMAVLMATTVIFIVLFTVIFGRLWCGWACPQTIFMEMVFRRIEYLFDGNYRKKRLKELTPALRTLKKIFKHITFYIVSIAITNVFLMWFTGPERLIEIITSPPSENIKGFLIMIGIATFYYWIYSYFREQVCTMVCPYGRIQGVLLDSKSITVTYDYKRGEPRGAKNSGDCIDCKQCISVCPTGIDIKNGTQLECVNCTACIDECNSVMRKIKKPEGLIRFDSVYGIESGKKSIINARTISYSVVLFLLLILLSFTIRNRSMVETSFLRVPGTLFQEIDQSTYSNIYTAKIINKTNSEKELIFKLLSPTDGEIQVTIPDVVIKSQGAFESVVIIRLKKEMLNGKSTNIKIGIFEDNRPIETIETNFIGPSN